MPAASPPDLKSSIEYFAMSVGIWPDSHRIVSKIIQLSVWQSAAALITLDGFSLPKDNTIRLMSPEYVRPYVKVPSGFVLEFVVAQSPSDMKLSSQAARSIG